MTEHVRIAESRGVGRITLTRPEALHALNEPMCRAILDALQNWKARDDIYLVYVDHEDQTRGFCAGGDIAMLRESGLSDGAEARAFFATEYQMNVAIKSFPKPYVAVMDGITMGGGVGLSVHGSYRIATERTVFAMPETGIGLFPDVGGGWFLPRLSGELGTWLALTGARLKGTDVCAAGIGTHFIPSELIPNLKAQIADADFSAGAAELLGSLLASVAKPVPEPTYAEHMTVINSGFAMDRAEDILDALENTENEWAQAQAISLKRKSPETVKVALKQIRLGRALTDFEDNMRMEYRIGWRKIQSPDFIEGVRAVILDKDNEPNWMPARLEDVTDADVDRYFASLDTEELQFD
ncbi:MAG: enoyl-CoA hydratase/isomerase family protein [Pseudomonadota bacterium]